MQYRFERRLGWILGFVLSALPIAAHAAEGVLEINAACAVNTGCFAGDAPGYPVEITTAAPAKSFLLTSDLVTPNDDTDGIEVLANDVTIDLGGFSIMGAACVGTNADCSPPSGGAGTDGDGIDAITSPAVYGLTVRNGQIVGTGRRGIDAGQFARIEDVQVRWNRSTGLVVGSNSTVTDVIAQENGSIGISIGSSSSATRVAANGNASTGVVGSFGTTLLQITSNGNANAGISVASNSVVKDSTATQNGDGGTFDHGISCGVNSMIEANVLFDNDGDGIDCADDSTILGNSVRDNANDGIECSNGCTIIGNTSFSNGADSSDDGIICLSGCNVQDNTSRSNAGDGIALGSESGYAGNIVTNNTGVAVSGGTDLGGNLCDAGAC